MKLTVNLKNLICGFALGIAAMLLVGAGTESNGSGRYMVSSAQGFAVIVDTKTGQAWGFGTANTTQYRTDSNFWDPK